MKKFAFFLFLSLLLALTAACGADTNRDEPPEIVYGQDTCDLCEMLIDDPRFAAAYVTEAGEVRRFDDIGDMLVDAQEQQAAVYRYWVHDYGSEAWVDAAQATFVRQPEMVTPMGWGVAAFATPADAGAFLEARGGRLLSLEDLHQAIAAGELMPQMMGNAGHGNHQHSGHQQEAGLMSEPMPGPDAEANMAHRAARRDTQ